MGLVRGGGRVSFIVSDSWMNSEYFSLLRNHLLTEHRIEVLAVFDYPVFRGVTLENSVFVVMIGENPIAIPIDSFDDPQNHGITNTLDPQDAVRRGLIDPRLSPASDAVLAKIERGSRPLERDVKINRGIHAYRTDGYGKSRFGPGP